MLQLPDDNRVLVIYSRFYLGKCAAPSAEQLAKNFQKFKDACPGLTSANQVRRVWMDISLGHL